MLTTVEDQIDAFLSTLDGKGRQALESRMAFDTKSGPANKLVQRVSDLTQQEALYWEALVEAIHTICLTDLYGSIARQINHEKLGRKRFTECAVALDSYVTHACSSLTLTHKRAVYIEVLSCLIRSMQHRGQDSRWITPITICQRIGELPQAVNKAYPGYVQARLLHVIIPKDADKGRLRA